MKTTREKSATKRAEGIRTSILNFNGKFPDVLFPWLIKAFIDHARAEHARHARVNICVRRTLMANQRIEEIGR